MPPVTATLPLTAPSLRGRGTTLILNAGEDPSITTLRLLQEQDEDVIMAVPDLNDVPPSLKGTDVIELDLLKPLDIER